MEHVKFGEKNLLAMRVTKNTKSSDLDSGDYFFLGGVHDARDVRSFLMGPEGAIHRLSREAHRPRRRYGDA